MMTENIPAVITISRQMGSGGPYLGQRLAEHFGLPYIDRQIITGAAEKLQVLENEIESREEKKSSFFETVLRSFAQHPPGIYYTPPILEIPSDEAIFESESEIITEISQKCSSVIIGRAAAHILRDHPRHLSVFLHADRSFRQQQIEKLFTVTPSEASRMIETSDKERAEYHKALTGQNWLDITRYHLAIDTGILGFEQAETLVTACIWSRFGSSLS